MLPVQRFLIQEEENEERQRILRMQRKHLRDRSDPFALPDQRFIDLFRLNKDLVHYLFNTLRPHLEDSMRNSRITKEARILAALRFFATGNYQRGTGEEYLISISQQVISKCIQEVGEAITQHMANDWVSFPITENQKQRNKAGFMEKAGFPGVIGCIDCTHVAMIAPAEEEHNFVNRKGFHSKNVQIICNQNLEILNVDPRFPGSSHDSFIWRSSEVKTLLERMHNAGDRRSWLLGDSGYPLEPWLMTPFQNPPPNSPESRYNRAHKITRSIIERCIGLLKMRFRCIMGERRLRYNPLKVGLIVNTCAILHNICIRAGVELPREGQREAHELHVFENANYIPGPANIHVIQGRQVRQQIVQTYFQN